MTAGSIPPAASGSAPWTARRRRPSGAVYQYRGGKLDTILTDVRIPNSTCFSPDGRIAYFADTPSKKIRKCAIDPATGLPIGEWTDFVDTSDHRGAPDGSVVDSEGYLWNARYHGSCVVRHAPDGSIDRVVELPVSQVTCPAFGGPDLKTLYITSASQNMTPEQLASGGACRQHLLDPRRCARPARNRPEALRHRPMTTPALGVCYYPEHWPSGHNGTTMPAAWPRSVSLYVRIGEFAWSRLEPKPGQLDFDWMIEAMDVLGAAGLKVIVGTPTATPPRWISTSIPTCSPSTTMGSPREFGSRRHYCFSHQGYREESRRITTLIAEKVGQPPRAGRLADRQRVWLPRHDLFLLEGGRSRFSRLAQGALRHDRRAQYGLGQRVLVDGTTAISPTRTAQSGGDGDQPRGTHGFPPLLLRPGGGLQQDTVRRAEGGAAGPAGDPQLHGPLHRVRPFRRGKVARRRSLGFLPARPSERQRRDGRGQGAVHAHRASPMRRVCSTISIGPWAAAAGG